MRRIAPFVWLIVLIAAALSRAAAPPSTRPRLVVLIIIDQFRPDYLTRFSDQFSAGGFRRLMDGGAWMTDATYSHLHVTTTPGHSVITSGTYGYQSGLIDNYWFDRTTGQPRPALADSQYYILGKPPQPDDHTSPRNIQGSTLGDELRMATNFKGKVMAVAMKDYSAIVCAGTLGTPYWFDTGAGMFTTSDYYMKTLPDWVTAFNARRLPEGMFGRQWTRLLPDSAYARSRPDSAIGERNYRGNGVTFPHTVTGGLEAPGEAFYAAFTHTPWSNEVELDFTRRVILEERLGQDDIPDLLIVSLSANDFVGHDFGPYSQEVQDMTVRTDRQLADFFGLLDRTVGLSRTLIVLSSDHGAIPIPEDSRAHGIEAGRAGPKSLIARVEAALDTQYGDDAWVRVLYRTGLYLNYETLRRHHLSQADVEATSARALMSDPSIAAAYTRTQLLNGQVPDTPLTRRVLRSFHPARSGDVIPVAKPFYVIIDEFSERTVGTTHGQPYNADLHVPVFFYGSSITPGRYSTPIDVADIVPTLCEILGLTFPSGWDGRVLGEVLK